MRNSIALACLCLLASMLMAGKPVPHQSVWEPATFMELSPDETYTLEITTDSGEVVLQDQILANHQGHIQALPYLEGASWYERLYSHDPHQIRPTDQWLTLQLKKDGYLLEQRRVPVAYFLEGPEEALQNKADRGIVFLPDPSSWTPYTCTFYQTITYNSRQFGNITGRVYRPVSGTCSSAYGPPANRPVVLLLNGQGYRYYDYDILGRHLAKNGFVVVIVEADESSPFQYCENGISGYCIADRARKGLDYLHLFKDNWTWSNQVDFTNISLVGHSRGGEAVLEAASVIYWEDGELGNPSARAVVSIAPTDIGDNGITGRRRLLGRECDDFLVLYGSRDEQVAGWDGNPMNPPFFLPHQTGFALYDRAGTENSLEGFPISQDNQIERSMRFIYQANHHQFSDRTGSSSSCWHPVMSYGDQRTLTKGFVNGYLMWKVYGWSGMQSYFDGVFENPWGEESWPQFSEGDWYSRRVIDNFQNDLLNTSYMGGSVNYYGYLDAEIVDNWDTTWRSYHGPDDGLRLKVSHDTNSSSNIIMWTIPSSKGNVSNFTHLSFRIGMAMDTAGSASLRVRMRRAGSWSGLLSTASYGDIPETDGTGGTFCPGGAIAANRTVVHMRTIRIPLADFGGDLSNVQYVQLRFDNSSTLNREIYLDNLEFTGGSLIIGGQAQ